MSATQRAPRVGLALHYVRGSKITGIERYGLVLARGLATLGTGELEVEAWTSRSADRLLDGTPLRRTRLPWDARLAGEQALPAWELLRRLDLVHVPAFGGAWAHRAPFVLTLHDSVFWDAPETLSTLGKWYYRPSVERALRSPKLRRVLFVSAAARDAALRHFPHLAPVAAVTGGATALPMRAAPREWNARADGPLRIVSVGTIEPRKNVAGMLALVRAMERLLGPGRVEWIVAGRRGWATDEEWAALQSPPVRYLGPVDDDALVALYASADLFLSLSRLEGFNLPIIEAMGQGTPAVLSALDVHREVGGPGAKLVDPDADVDATARHVLALIEEPARWEARSALALQQARKFTPSELARRTLDVYRDALG